ncbi:MAG: RelA/SpoT domain-containing protein [Candidatus Margulisiibacteriota bacterium]
MNIFLKVIADRSSFNSPSRKPAGGSISPRGAGLVQEPNSPAKTISYMQLAEYEHLFTNELRGLFQYGFILNNDVSSIPRQILSAVVQDSILKEALRTMPNCFAEMNSHGIAHNTYHSRDTVMHYAILLNNLQNYYMCDLESIRKYLLVAMLHNVETQAGFEHIKKSMNFPDRQEVLALVRLYQQSLAFLKEAISKGVKREQLLNMLKEKTAGHQELLILLLADIYSVTQTFPESSFTKERRQLIYTVAELGVSMGYEHLGRKCREYLLKMEHPKAYEWVEKSLLVEFGEGRDMLARKMKQQGKVIEQLIEKAGIADNSYSIYFRIKDPVSILEKIIEKRAKGDPNTEVNSLHDILGWTVLFVEENDLYAFFLRMLSHTGLDAGSCRSDGQSAVRVFAQPGDYFHKIFEDSKYKIIDNGRGYQSIHLTIPRGIKDLGQITEMQLTTIEKHLLDQSTESSSSHIKYKQEQEEPKEAESGIDPR